jgi:hypothetical protein
LHITECFLSGKSYQRDLKEHLSRLKNAII